MKSVAWLSNEWWVYRGWRQFQGPANRQSRLFGVFGRGVLMICPDWGRPRGPAHQRCRTDRELKLADPGRNYTTQTHVSGQISNDELKGRR